MDWLKDKKNQPIVAAIAAVVIVGVIVFLWLTVFSSGGSDSASIPPDQSGMPADGTTTTPAPGDPSGAAPAAGTMSTPGPSTPPAGPGAPAATQPGGAAPAAGAAGQTAVASATPMESYRKDPFLPVGYKPRPVSRLTPPIPDLPILNLGPWPKPVPVAQRAEPPQPVRRLAGVMLNGRVYAIIETAGYPSPQIVQPGEPLADGLAIVQSIEADKVILKTTSAAPRYLTVRLASAARRPASEASATPSVSPMGPTGPMGPSPMRPSRRGSRGEGGGERG